MNNKILFIISNDIISFKTTGGGSSIYLDQMIAFKKLGFQIDLFHFATKEKRNDFNNFYNENPDEKVQLDLFITKYFFNIVEYDKNYFDKIVSKLFHFVQLSKYGLTHGMYKISSNLNFISKNNYDFMIAHGLSPLSIALNTNLKNIVYAHHDWNYRIKALKSNRPIDNKAKLEEEKLCKISSLIITGSQTEFKDLFFFNSNVFNIPVSYPFLKSSKESVISNTPNIVHLGGMSTTSNRLGIADFFANCWDLLGWDTNRFIVIGSLNGADQQLCEKIKVVNYLGFVNNVSSVLNFGDIHIIPWNYDTGQRTKIPYILAAGQVLVAMENGVKSNSSLKDGFNCFLVDSFEEMKIKIQLLESDHNLRNKMASNAVLTYNKYLDSSVFQIRYQSISNYFLKS